jgi:hypothetical protein
MEIETPTNLYLHISTKTSQLIYTPITKVFYNKTFLKNKIKGIREDLKACVQKKPKPKHTYGTIDYRETQ